MRGLSRFLEATLTYCRLPAPRWMHRVWWLLEYGRWVRSIGDRPCFDDRFQLHAEIVQRIGDRCILFLEFGVADGASFRFWLGHHSNRESRFVGFDTFEGLPAPWDRLTFSYPRGHFGTAGEPPPVHDHRATFVPGLFQDTLPSFEKSLDRSMLLVIHLDADLFESTLFVLTCLHRHLDPGTIVIFDDLGIADHDFRAFRSYTAAFRRSFEVLAFAGPAFRRVAMQIVG